MPPDDVTVLVEMKAKPGRREELGATLFAMFPDTRTRDGFIDLRLVRSLDDEQSLLILERWRSRTDHEAYSKWRRERGDQNALRDLLAAPPTRRYFTNATAPALE